MGSHHGQQDMGISVAPPQLLNLLTLFTTETWISRNCGDFSLKLLSLRCVSPRVLRPTGRQPFFHQTKKNLFHDTQQTPQIVFPSRHHVLTRTSLRPGCRDVSKLVGSSSVTNNLQCFSRGGHQVGGLPTARCARPVSPNSKKHLVTALTTELRLSALIPVVIAHVPTCHICILTSSTTLRVGLDKLMWSRTAERHGRQFEVRWRWLHSNAGVFAAQLWMREHEVL